MAMITAFDTSTLIAFLGASLALYLMPGADMMFIGAGRLTNRISAFVFGGLAARLAIN